MHGYTRDASLRRTEGNECNGLTITDHLMPKHVIEAIEAVIRTGKEAIVRKERGKWVVLESGRRLVYKEP